MNKEIEGISDNNQLSGPGSVRRKAMAIYGGISGVISYWLFFKNNISLIVDIPEDTRFFMGIAMYLGLLVLFSRVRLYERIRKYFYRKPPPDS